ncbi:MAG: hypothetical protein AAFQ98_04600 [Bacteroidota bacterium]
MNKWNNLPPGFWVLGVLVSLLAACDRLDDDVRPDTGPQESIIQLPQENYQVRPGGQILIDLLEGINTSAAVSISITTPPSAGDASISQGRYIHYRSTSQQPQSDFFVFEVADGDNAWDADTVRIEATTTLDGCTDGMFFSTAEGTSTDGQLEIRVPIPSVVNECYPWVNEANYEAEILNGDDVIGNVLFSNQIFYYFPQQNVGDYSTQVFYVVNLPGESEQYYGALEIFIEEGFDCEDEVNVDILDLELINPEEFPSTFTFGVSDLTANDIFCEIPTEITLGLIAQNWVHPVTVELQNNTLVVTLADSSFFGLESINYTMDAPEWEEPITSAITVNGKVESGDDQGGGPSCMVRAQADTFTIPASLIAPGGFFDELVIRFDILFNDTYCTLNGATEFIIIQDPGIGEATPAGFSIEYTRPRNGDTSTTTLRYQLCSGTDCQEATVTINVE